MSNNDGKSSMPNCNGIDPMFAAFHNLRLHNNNNHFEVGESSNRNNNVRGDPRNSNNNNSNYNLNVNYNYGHISLGNSRLSAGGLRAPPSAPSWFNQSDASSSTNVGQPSASPHDFMGPHIDLDLMKCHTRYPEFLGVLESIDNFEKEEREKELFNIGYILTTNSSVFLDLATDQNGSHSLRTLVKRSPTLDALILNAVCAHFCLLMNSKYGHSLVAHIIRAVDKSKKEILFNLTYNYTLLLASQETGCVALNDVLQEIRGRFRDLIFDRIAENAGWLSFDPYGTHVVQNILTLQNPRATRVIAENLYGNFFRLGMGRQGSYVVEKCLKSAFARRLVLEEFRTNNRELVRMANDRFGNFVVQCALRVMKQLGMVRLLREFVDKLRPHFREMKNGHGNNTLRMIEEEIEECLYDYSFM